MVVVFQQNRTFVFHKITAGWAPVRNTWLTVYNQENTLETKFS